MSIYHSILLAVDLTPASLLIGERARALATAFDAELHVLHVVEPILPVVPMPPGSVAPSMMATQAKIFEIAEEQIAKLADQLGVPPAHRTVVVGSTKSEIVRAAVDLGIDLIVIGNHERHGFAVLFRSTEDAVVHHAPCDVLAVHLSDERSRNP